MEWVQFFLIGGLVGLLAGVFGVGGGSIMVPVLMLIFDAKGFPQQAVAHMAIGTSFAVIVFTSMGSVWGHHRKANINWKLWRYLAVTLVFGVSLGSWLATEIPSIYLEPFIGLFFVFVALQMAFDLLPESDSTEPSKFGASVAGFGIGGASAFLGIGGGAITVPWLRYCAVPMHTAIGTSAACGLPIAMFGALSYWWFGRMVESQHFADTGFIYLPAFIGIALTSVPAATMGAKIGRQFSGRVLSRWFAALLFFVAAYVLLKALFQLGVI